MVNKKAIITYIILLIIVAAVCSYIYFSETGGALYSNPSITRSTTIATGTKGVAIGPAGNGSRVVAGIIAEFYNKSYAASVPTNGSFSCNAASPYTCSQPLFYATQGVFTFNFSQRTGAVWQSARLFFVNYTDIPRFDQYTGYSNNGTQISGLAPGVLVHVVLYTRRQQLGAHPYGEIWSLYQLAGSSSLYYAEIGNVTLRNAT